MEFILKEMDEELDFVLIYEYLDESLVLLQRMLCWQLEDIIYLKSDIASNNFTISKKTKVITSIFMYLNIPNMGAHAKMGKMKLFFQFFLKEQN